MTSNEIAFEHIIPEQRMKVSRFPDLNDPFELASHDLGNKSVREKARAYIAEASNRFGLICFSDNWKSPVMWAHYSHKHTGVCLGFDISDGYVTPIQYLEARALHHLDDKSSVDSHQFQFIDQMLYHKAQEWSYEREIRAIVLLDGPRRPMYHIPFGYDLQLREIIIGCRNPLSPIDLEPFVLPQETSVQILKARPAFKRFEMVPNRRYKAVAIPATKDCSKLHGTRRTGPRFLSCADFSKKNGESA